MDNTNEIVQDYRRIKTREQPLDPVRIDSASRSWSRDFLDVDLCDFPDFFIDFNEISSLNSNFFCSNRQILSLASSAIKQTTSYFSCRLLEEISLHQVLQHSSTRDCWVIIYDKVYDVTRFISQVRFLINIFTSIEVEIWGFQVKNC